MTYHFTKPADKALRPLALDEDASSLVPIESNLFSGGAQQPLAPDPHRSQVKGRVGQEELPATHPGPGRRDPRTLDRGDPLPEDGRAQGVAPPSACGARREGVPRCSPVKASGLRPSPSATLDRLRAGGPFPAIEGKQACPRLRLGTYERRSGRARHSPRRLQPLLQNLTDTTARTHQTPHGGAERHRSQLVTALAQPASPQLYAAALYGQAFSGRRARFSGFQGREDRFVAGLPSLGPTTSASCWPSPGAGPTPEGNAPAQARKPHRRRSGGSRHRRRGRGRRTLPQAPEEWRWPPRSAGARASGRNRAARQAGPVRSDSSTRLSGAILVGESASARCKQGDAKDDRKQDLLHDGFLLPLPRVR